MQLSSPKVFEKGVSICHEGEPGKEMYVILQGGVDVYISSVLESSVRVAHVKPGGFFGEMAIFDDLPRSASCVAHEKTVCIAISKEMLPRFIVSCPDIAEKLIINLSARIRELNNRLFKVDEAPHIDMHPFSIPEGHCTSTLSNPQTSQAYLDRSQVSCPVCGKPIVIQHIKEHLLTRVITANNQRCRYREMDPVWHQIWHCQYCGYSNYHLNFFHINCYERAGVLQLVNGQSQYQKTRFPLKSVFDTIVFEYYQAIHFNECFNLGGTLLIGRLWECLYWLYGDAKQKEMEKFCRAKVIEFYKKTLEEHPEQLSATSAKQKCLLVLAELLMESGNEQEAKQYFTKATKFPNTPLTAKIYERMPELKGQSGGQKS